MKKITLERLKISNFKGVSSLDISFDGTESTIKGANATGKTSIFDAFTWLILDKDSDNRADFNIKPLDKNNNYLRVDVEVEGYFDIDGMKVVLKKMYKENWTKKRGSSEEVYTGNKMDYEIDDIPYKKNDYKKYIEDKFTSEDLFKLLTNPLFFSTQVKWKDAREMVMSIVGDVAVTDVVAIEKDIEPIQDDIEAKGVDNLLKSKKASMKKLADEKKELPARVSELQNMIVNVDVEAIEKEIKGKENEIKKLEEKMSGINDNSDEINKLIAEKLEVESRIRKIKSNATDAALSKKNELRSKLADLTLIQKMNDAELKTMTTTKNCLDSDIKRLKDRKDELAKEYATVYTSKPENLDGVGNCPTCGRPLDNADDVIEKYISSFNSKKASKLEKIANEGKKIASDIEIKEEQLNETIACIEGKEKELENINSDLNKINEALNNCSCEPEFTLQEVHDISNYETVLDDIKERLEVLKNSSVDSEKEGYRASIEVLKKDIKGLSSKLGQAQINENTRSRIDELEAKEKEVVRGLASIQRDIELCELFITTRVSLLESNINNHFKGVEFKLFETQVNGGINECCKAMVDGVPYSDLNTASKINAGLAIIDVIGKHYDVRLPIFIDNRESIIKLEKVDTQVINLVADDIDSLEILGGKFNE